MNHRFFSIKALILGTLLVLTPMVANAVEETTQAVPAASASPAATPSEEKVTNALKELSLLVGHTVTTTVEARELCNKEEYLTACAEIGKKHKLYLPEREKTVDVLLEQLKGKIVEQLKQCKTQECLLEVANTLRQKLTTKDAEVAKKLNLTKEKIDERKAVIDAAKEKGVTIEQCKTLKTASASVEKLNACRELVKDPRVQAAIPITKRAENAQSQKMIDFRATLESKSITCADNTVEGCTKYCLTPSATVPDVCREIAQKYFGPDVIRKIEQAHTTPKPLESRPTPARDTPGLISRFLDFLSL